MAMDELYQIRELLNQIYELCDTIEEVGCWSYTGRIKMSDALMVELFNFLHYLSASDGAVTQRESAFFKTVLDIDISIDDIIQRVKYENLYSEEFERKVPLVIRGAVDADRKTGTELSGAKLIANLFSVIGQAFVSVDGIDSQEIEDYKIYMNTINSFIKKAELDDASEAFSI